MGFSNLRTLLPVWIPTASLSRSATVGRSRRPALLFAAFVLALSISACSSDTDTAVPVVERLSYTRLQSGARIVSGELFNPSDHPISGAQIQVSLFDGTNARVGSVSIPVQNIPAQGRVTFRHPLDTDADVQAARVRSVIIL